MTRPIVLKFGGELVEESEHRMPVVAAIAEILGTDRSLVLVHGGGKEIDRALERNGIAKQQIDGLRITDDRTLSIVVSVLAGVVNPWFVAALNAAGVPAVGLTGADGCCVRSTPASSHRARDGRLVDLGRVGVPDRASDMRLIETLLSARFVPVLASIGIDADGRLLNVNADTLAGSLAARLGARRLVVAGTTPGVLADDGRTLQQLDAGRIAALIANGTATGGMIAKLSACEHALAHGVDDVVIVDGRDQAAIANAARGNTAGPMTRVSLAVNRRIREPANP